MTRAGVIALLAELEKKFDFANEAFIGDVNIWPLIKIKLGEQLVSGDMGTIAPIAEPQKKATRIIKGGLDLLGLKKKLSKSGDVLFISSKEYWTKVNGLWTERFAHPFMHQLEKSNVVPCIATIRSRHQGASFLSCNEIDLQDAIYLKSLIWWRKEPRPELPKIISDCLASLGSAGYEIDRSYLNEMVFTLLFYDQLFTSLLENSRIKTVFLICYYSVHNMGLSQAASRLGIKTVDMQHGVQGMNNIAYGNWRLPASGYSTLPKWFWCWQQSDADHINSWAEGTPHGALPGGELWSMAWQDGYYSIYSEGSLPDNPKNDLVALFTMQNVNDPIPEVLIQAIQRSENIQWWFRDHPMHRKIPQKLEEQLEELGIAEKVTHGAPSDLPLPLVLSAIDVHLTNWSSVVLDAERMGIRSVILHPTGKDVFNDLIEQDRVDYFSSDHHDLLDMIIETAKKKCSFSGSSKDVQGHLDMILDTTEK